MAVNRRPPRRDASRSDRSPGLAARLGALQLIGAVLDKGAMLDDQRLDLPPEERAQAQTLASVVLRRLGQIDDLVSRFVPKMPKPPVNHTLRLVAAELCFVGTPAHAALDLAVRAVKQAGAPKMSGLVNAVGRRMAEQGRAIVEAQQATTLAMPKQLRKRVLGDWGKDITEAIARAHLMEPDHDLTPRDLNDTAGLAQRIGGRILPNGSIRLPRGGQLSAMDGFAEGQWWVQDAAASLPVKMLGEVAGLRVLDLCAAPGGKTLQLASLGAEVTALDLSERRMGRVAENLDRMKLSAKIVVADALRWEPDSAFDAIVLDAPCSATGTVRRHPDLPHRDFETGLAELTTLQAKLMDRAFGWLRPGGRLLYCTCSLLRSEGEAQSKAFLARTPSAHLRPADLPGMSFAFSKGALRTRPDQWQEQGGIDGFYAAIFAKDSPSDGH
ncbi:MAG: transcription antitermination factor NusB [Pseudomonadota bacterium]